MKLPIHDPNKPYRKIKTLRSIEGIERRSLAPLSSEKSLFLPYQLVVADLSSKKGLFSSSLSDPNGIPSRGTKWDIKIKVWKRSITEKKRYLGWRLGDIGFSPWSIDSHEQESRRLSWFYVLNLILWCILVECSLHPKWFLQNTLVYFERILIFVISSLLIMEWYMYKEKQFALFK